MKQIGVIVMLDDGTFEVRDWDAAAIRGIPKDGGSFKVCILHHADAYDPTNAAVSIIEKPQ